MEVEQQSRQRLLVAATGTRRWSGRARRLIEQVHALSLQWLQEPFRLCMVEMEHQLLTLADRAHDSFNQQRHFASRQRLQQERAALKQGFFENITRAFGQLGEPVDAPPVSGNAPLTLLDTAEHEITAQYEKLNSRGEARAGAALHELGYRLGVLVATPPLEGEQVPMGPLALAKALRRAASAIGLSSEHDLLLLQCAEQVMLRDIAQLCGLVNERLRDEGILPQLRPFPLPRPVVSPKRTTPEAESVAADRDDARQPAAGPTRGGSARGSASGSDEPIAVLDSLRDLLARRRTGQTVVGGEPAQIATKDELQTALSALQQHLSKVTDQASRELRSAQLLREELLTQLNIGKPAGAARTGLSPEQGDTVELVSMLFEQLSQQLQHGEDTQSLLGGLQLPVLRMAVSDSAFFEQKEHPARQLLGTVTEVAHQWLDDSGSEADRSLRAKLEQLVERASREPPSAGLYTALLADIQQHLALLTRKAQAAERRHVEAMQGRERLDQARQRASALISERFATSPPRGLLRALLDRAWSDVLALTLLRHGEESDAFINQLAITDQLLGRKPVADRAQLQADVETGLQQIGMHHEEAAQVAQRLANPSDSTPVTMNGEVLSNTDLALRLKQHQRLGEHAPASEAPAPAPAEAPEEAASPEPAEHAAPEATPAAPSDKATGAPPARPPKAKPAAAAPTVTRRRHSVDPREVELQEQLRLLPFGTWFEFTDRKTGKLSQRKLAWFSPVSGQTLFVTRRGLRADEMTLPQLAHEIARGRAREIKDVKETLLDRAWRSLTGSLLRQPGRPSSHRSGA